MLGLKGLTYEEKCAELGLATLEERRGGQDMALVHKFLTEQTGTDLFRLTVAQDRARTRQAAGEHDLSVKFSWTVPRKVLVCCKDSGQWEQAAGGGKIFPKRRNVQEPAEKNIDSMIHR
jgi:hypothetical protein